MNIYRSLRGIGRLRPASLALALIVAIMASPDHAASVAPGVLPLPVMLPLSGLTAAQTAMLLGDVGTFVAKLVDETSIQLVPVPAGTFLMGSPADEAGRLAAEGPQTQVTLTHGFFLGATVVTQAQWKGLTRRVRSIIKGDDLPIVSVSWEEATEFCRKLTVRQRTAGNLPEGYTFTLPTEAQWEYACRAGTTTANAGELGAMAWYLDNGGGGLHPVGVKQANGWSLFDMNGNVWQWCRDWHGDYPGGKVSDPTGAAKGTFRVYRGGAWWNAAAECRSASRNTAPNFRSSNVGFRLALVPTLPSPP